MMTVIYIGDDTVPVLCLLILLNCSSVSSSTPATTVSSQEKTRQEEEGERAVRKYIALYQFDARSSDELSLAVDDTVWVQYHLCYI